MNRSRLLALVLAAACGGGSPAGPATNAPPGGGGPGGSPPPDGGDPAPVLTTLRLQPADTTLAELDVDVGLRVEALDASGASIDVPSNLVLETVDETPALTELPVVDRLDSGRRRVTVGGPGTARVRVRVGEVVSAEATLRVEPPDPIVAGVVGDPAVAPGDRVELRGYRLDRIPAGALTYRGEPVEILETDASSLAFRAPDREVGACEGAAAAEIAVADVRVLRPVLLSYDREGTLALAVGEIAFLGPLREGCLALPAGDTGSYTLMLVDTRALESARTRMEDFSIRLGKFRFAVRDRSGSDVTASTERSTALPSPVPPVRAPASSVAHPTGSLVPSQRDPFAHLWHRRTTPWQEGDAATVFQIPGYPVVDYGTPATIVRTYGSIFALAVPDRDLEEYAVADRLSVIDDAMADILETAVPLFHAAFSENRPMTSSGSGQVLLVLAAGGGTQSHMGSAIAPDRVPDTGGWIALDSGAWLENMNELIWVDRDVLAHELAHAWQGRYEDDVCLATAVCGSHGGYPWGSEGSADLIATEFQRRIRDQPLHGNLDWGALWGGVPTLFGHVSDTWTFAAGYRGSWWYLHDLLSRAVLAGVPYERALAQVSRGAVDGWFGHIDSGRRRGLEARMRELLGPGFDVREDLLRAAIRLVVDDLTDDPDLQHPWVRNAWELFPPIATIRPGEGTEIDDESFGTGMGYVRIEDGGVGGSYRFEASVEGVHWIVARTR